MIENEKFKIHITKTLERTGLSYRLEVWNKEYRYSDLWCNILLEFEPSHLYLCVSRRDLPTNQQWRSYFIEKSFFTNFYNVEENDFLLYFIANNNPPMKYLKFVVGLYKLHTNQISTSELEQLVLDNIEDLL